MKNPIIEIQRASESTIKYLLEVGILYVGDDNQIHVTER